MEYYAGLIDAAVFFVGLVAWLKFQTKLPVLKMTAKLLVVKVGWIGGR
jgi:hypothetical protein